jgi:hypothetical protein
MVHMSSGGDTSGSSRMPAGVSSSCSGVAAHHTGFVAAVSQVGIHGPRLCLGRCDGDAVLLGIVEQILPALEAVAELGQPPRRNDLDGGLEGVEGQLEADLVVALAGAAVRNEAALFLLGFVRCIALHRAEAELLDEFLLQVEDDHLQRADLERLLLDLVPGLFLANIGEEAHDLISFLCTSISSCLTGW